MTKLEFLIAALIFPAILIAALAPFLRQKSYEKVQTFNKLEILLSVCLLTAMYFALESLSKNQVLVRLLLFSEFMGFYWFASLATNPAIKYLHGRISFLTLPAFYVACILCILYLSPRFTHATLVWLCIIGTLFHRLNQALSFREDYVRLRHKLMTQQSNTMNTEIIEFVANTKNSNKTQKAS